MTHEGGMTTKYRYVGVQFMADVWGHDMQLAAFVASDASLPQPLHSDASRVYSNNGCGSMATCSRTVKHLGVVFPEF